MNVYVTGIGVVSAIGNNVIENYDSLISNRSGIQSSDFSESGKSHLLGRVKLTDDEIIGKYSVSNLPVSRTSLLGIAAATEAWGNNHHNERIRTGLISSTSVGGMDRSEKYYQQLLGKGNVDNRLILTHDSGGTSEKIADKLGIEGYVNTLSTACSSSLNSIMLGARMIQQNKLDKVLVGGSDAITDFTINGFKSLMIYSDELCKPFDEDRNGLNLGEGAAFLVLESEESLKTSKNKPLCKLVGWCNAADAFHQTASSPEGKGATLAIEGALKQANLQPKDIDYINAHGTATKNNDLTESKAILSVFKDGVPPFSSTKAFTGHTLAAAGAIETVFSILSLNKRVMFPNLNYNSPIEETKLRPVNSLTTTENIKTVLSNSFGFGGNNSTVILQKL
jgi:3-oxoacyl-(acyl-carrier-protein) synthase